MGQASDCDLIGRLDVGRLQPFGAGGYFKADALAFGQGFETLGLDGGKVGKQIFAAVFGRNKAKTFGFIKPFHCTCTHVLHFLKKRESPLGAEGQDRRSDEGRNTYEGRTKTHYNDIT